MAHNNMFSTAFLLLLLNCHHCLAHIRIDAPEVHTDLKSKPTFVRYAVESVPRKHESAFMARISLRPSFGDMFLPLRSAVESVPTVNVNDAEKLGNLRTFLRDSIEATPNEEYSIENEEESGNIDELVVKEMGEKYSTETLPTPDEWNVSQNYSAFLDNAEEYEPQAYRIDSPYQKLVQSSELLSYGALAAGESFSEETAVEEEQPYGALAMLRATPKPSKKTTSAREIMCHITNWAFYRESDSKFVPEQLDTTLCTTLIYSFATLDPDHLVIREFDPWVDIENEYYKRATNIGLPVLIAMGGWTDSNGDKYSRLAADDIKRRIYAANLASFIARNGFSGIHFDWNYPVCWQSDCSRGPAADKPNLTKLLQEIRREFDRVNKNLRIGLAVSGYHEIIVKAYDFPAISNIVDYMTVMSYDYHGAWERQTGHVSPLYGRKSDKYPQYNTDYAMQLILKMGAKREKMIMGIPFYGQTFTLQNEHNKLVGEGVPSSTSGQPGEFTKQPGMLAYYEICQRIRKQRWLSGRDAEEKSGPYAMLRNQWVSFDDPISVANKVRYVQNNGFAGVAAWTVDLDDFQNTCCTETYPLLKAINRQLGRLKTSKPNGRNCDKPQPPITPTPPKMTTVSSDGAMGSTTTAATTTTTKKQVMTTSSTTPWWTTTTTKRTSTSTTTKRPQLSTTSSTVISHTTIPSPAVVKPMIKPKKCEVGQFYPDNSNCNAYYQCISVTELRQQYCPGGLHWNQNARNCDWPASAKCKVKKPTSHIVHDPIPSTSRPHMYITSVKPATTMTKPPVSAKCKEGEYYSHRNCGQFYVCVNGRLVPNTCGSNLHWDAIRKICDWPENVKCLTTRQYLRIVKFRANAEDPCNGEERVSYPGDCTKYLFCLWNRFQEANCAPGLHFSSATSNCDWPKNAKCDEGSTEAVEVTPIGSNEITAQKPATTQQPTTSTSAKPTYPTNKPNLKPLDGYYKVVCYFTNWAWYRKGLGKYTPENINTDLCTHIVYGFAVLDYSELTVRTHDSWADIDNNFYTRVSGLKSKGVKVSLGLGGWNDSQGDKYSRLVRNPQARARFIKHMVDFLDKYGFEGLDLDWEYPVCWQTDCSKGFADEKEGFTSLVQELSEAFKNRGYLLSTAVSPSKKIIDAGYDVPKLSKYFDWIAVMTYDFHGQWDKRTGHVAPLFYHPDDEFDYFNANFSLNYWIEKGAPSRKIVMGMPLYGQSFTLENLRNNGLNARAPGPGRAGEFTRAAGFLAYYEICDRIKHQGWEVVRDPAGRMGPYAYKDTQWVSFDDAAMIRKKSQLVRALNLGGGMVWALDLDDFKNRCGDGVHPLLTQIHDVLREPPKANEAMRK